MRTIALLATALVLTTFAIAVAPAPAQATSYWTGTVTHVSTNNIKVKNASGTVQSFLIAPSFDQIFSSDGKTTYQMKNLKPGTHVKVSYHQSLGARYADKIIVLSH